ncbi:hypothetical protein B9G55_22640 [Saccharibacillus sp. O16]|nr:hypothetical protein B9G55_22640 [Saccharibacillus sp. O16]
MNHQDGKPPAKPITYGESHMAIVRSGAASIEAFLLNVDDAERLNMLFCLDRYLDPYFGYNLPYAGEIFEILQRELLRERSRKVKDDIFQLIDLYAGRHLDTLANRIDEVEPHWLGETLRVLGGTYNPQYVSTIQRFLDHDEPPIRAAAQEALDRIQSVR